VSEAGGSTWDAGGGGGPTPDPLRSGSGRVRIGLIDGRFEVHGLLGRGGMGAVYRARDRSSGRWLALKVIQEAPDGRRLERFRREGEITAALDHPGIVRVHSAGEVRGLPYLAYELVEGARALSAAWAEADLRRRVGLVRDAAAAIGHAHAAGVVHRDVKPDNLLVDGGGRVRVTDFGLAAGRDLARLTQTGAALGTPSYMAPEAFERDRTRPMGPPSDVWSLGVVLYEALCGRLPFSGRNVFELAAQVVRGEPTPPRRVDRGVPADLEAVCLRALRVVPGARYPDAAALADDLDAWLSGRPVSAEGSTLGRLGLGRRGRLAAALGLGAAVVLVGVGWRVSRGPAEAAATRPGPAPARSSGPAPRPSAPETPEWYRRLPAGERPETPLPAGLAFAPDRPEEYVNARDGSRLVWVPPGTFTMGSTRGNPDEQPVREVTLTRGYFVGLHEVTWGQFRAFCAATGRPVPEAPARSPLALPTGDAFPVTYVSWDDAAAYCAWAGLRLPTEAEWARAARGDDGQRYPWGDEEPTPAHGNVLNPTGRDDPFLEASPEEPIPGAADPYAYTAPVGAYPLDRSPFGCLDMAGNVLEWVADRYTERSREEDTVDPRGPRTGRRRVRRGACWNSPEKHMRSANRAAQEQGTGDVETGFRVAR